MRRIVLALSGSLLVAAVAGCGASGARSSSASSSPLPSSPAPATAPPAADPTTLAAPTSSTLSGTAIDTSVVPARITPAYVDAVFAQLDHVVGNAIRTILAQGEITPKTQLYLSSIYTPAQFKIEAKIFTKVFALRNPGLRNHPGDPMVSVAKLRTATRDCIFLTATTDLSKEVSPGLPSIHHDYYELTSSTPSQRALGNPTPWVIAGSAAADSGVAIKNPCT